ncbi:MAG: hypothetical protein WBX15_06815 [Thermoanaerobaculia bacterium]
MKPGSVTRGGRVGFLAPDGRTLQGMMLRLNKKTISAAPADGHELKVAPGFLRLVQSEGDVQWP